METQTFLSLKNREKTLSKKLPSRQEPTVAMPPARACGVGVASARRAYRLFLGNCFSNQTYGKSISSNISYRNNELVKVRSSHLTKIGQNLEELVRLRIDTIGSTNIDCSQVMG